MTNYFAPSPGGYVETPAVKARMAAAKAATAPAEDEYGNPVSENRWTSFLMNQSKNPWAPHQQMAGALNSNLPTAQVNNGQRGLAQFSGGNPYNIDPDIISRIGEKNQPVDGVQSGVGKWGAPSNLKYGQNTF